MPSTPSRILRRAFVAGMLAACGIAQAAWPERPLTIVAPYPAGGAADVLSRLLARKLESELGQPVIVDNKPGAGTAIGAGFVANAKPDGYTLLVSSNSTFTLNPALQSRLPYDAARSFDAIGLVGSVALALLVNPSVPANNVAQLVAAVKAHPDKFVYGSFGNGTSSNFAGAMFNAAAGLKMTHVPYRGSAPLMTDLIGGQVPISFDTVVAAAPQLQSGKVKVLAVTSAKRSSLLPNVPTIAESGYPGFDMTAWIAVVGPHGLPPDVRARLQKAVATVVASPDMQEKMKAAGFEPGWQPVPDWAGFVTGDIARMKAIAQRAQIRLD
jgi:tripartite-type tricarboxylate transporter receptor subunit TctC